MTQKTEESATPPPSPAPPVPSDQLVVSHHSVTIDGTKIDYAVTTGTIVLKEETEKTGEQEGEAQGEQPRATVFFVAYTRTDSTDAARRPLTFSFNGGPGSSSVWLHLGVLGPRRVVMDEVGNLTQPPYTLADNPQSLLDRTDLVFIDPVSTGYSRAVTGQKAKDFHAFKKDIESVGDFIRLYTTRYRRWLSPKFLIGESYGTTRAAGLSSYLQERHGMYLNGIMLVSSVLDFQTLDFCNTNDLPYILYLPSYTATAWYHRRLAPELQKDLRATLKEVEAFAIGDYASALLRGASLPADASAKIAERVARYTGLTVDYVKRANLRIEIMRFTRELLRDRSRTVGRLDSRFQGIERDDVGERLENDPSFTNIIGPYTAAFNDYIRGELGYESDLPYEILSLKTNMAWKFDEHENRFVEVIEKLRKAMTINPFLKVFVASGYYDLATPYFATEYSFDHLSLDETLRPNLSKAYYEAGHMMYIHEPSLVRLKQDLAGFIGGAVPA